MCSFISLFKFSLSNVLRSLAIFSRAVGSACLSVSLVSKRVMGFPWCPVKLVFWKVMFALSSFGRVLRTAVRTFSRPSVACAKTRIWMCSMGVLEVTRAPLFCYGGFWLLGFLLVSGDGFVLGLASAFFFSA